MSLIYKSKYIGILTLLFLSSVLLLFMCLAFGSTSNSLLDQNAHKIIYQIRLPMVLTAILCGGALSVAGLILQSLFRNLLAGPSLLGVSTGAMLGASIYYIYFNFLPHYMLSVFAFVFSLLVLLVLLYFSFRVNNQILLIFGVLLSFIGSALIDLLKFLASGASLQNITYWFLADFSATTNTEVIYLLIFICLAMVLLLPILRALDFYDLGDAIFESHYSYKQLKKTKILSLLSSGLLVSVSTAYCGPVAFIGLVVPQIVRLSNRSFSYAQVLPITFLLGSILAQLCLLVQQNLSQTTLLPLNTITSLFGLPIILYVLLKKDHL